MIRNIYLPSTYLSFYMSWPEMVGILESSVQKTRFTDQGCIVEQFLEFPRIFIMTNSLNSQGFLLMILDFDPFLTISSLDA